ncbi:hypothetical protein MOO44_04220 [Nicoliella spurrieriana]|uniref:Uncharacterized protein n=1 Tax=Nicoliella spurrieriana TaxID=2925830 RepID=A0A976RT02_9LACO|nr:hypothetical protein [Nicoliella spurrieriana]UQS87365.1 hypothetical protein MOO44_04220 [Nicoliella spurrieriana]
MAELIQVLERHQHLIKVKYRGEFGYFWPSTNLTGHGHQLGSFDDADAWLLKSLGRSANTLILVPIAFDPHQLVFIIQVLDKHAMQTGGDGEVRTFSVTADGQIKNSAVD